MLDNRKRDFVILLASVVVLMLLPLKVGEYYLYLIRLIGIYAILSLGLNIFMGYAGQVNFGLAAFFCIGAYGSTLLQVKLGWHYVAAFPAAIILALLVAWGIGFALLRLRGHVAAIGTVAFALAVFLVVDRFPELTGGGDGITVPAMILFGHPAGETFFYYFILAFVVVCYLFCYFLVDSRIGRALEAMRDDEAAAAAMGVNVYHYKTLSWLVSCVFGGIAGGLYAQQAGFIAPSLFALWTNVIVVIMIIVGGLGINLGSLVGAAVMTLLPYFIQAMAEYVLLIQGAILFIILRFLPDGIVGTIAKLVTARTLSKKRVRACA